MVLMMSLPSFDKVILIVPPMILLTWKQSVPSHYYWQIHSHVYSRSGKMLKIW